MRARRPLRTRKRPEPVNRERRARLSEIQYGDDAFVFWLHTLPCVIPGCGARDVEQAHAVARSTRGGWRDSFPFCRDHHREQHAIGLLTFEAKYGLSLIDCAAEVQRAWAARNGDA